MNTTPSYYYNSKRLPDRRKRQRNGESATWKLTEIQNKHHRIINMLYKGYSNRYIAQKLGVSEVMVSNVKNSPVAQDKLTIMERATEAEEIDLRKEILKSVPECQQTLMQILRSPNSQPALKARIAMDQLDRAGFAPIKQVETKNLHAHRYIDDDDIKRLKKRAKELAAENGITI